MERLEAERGGSTEFAPTMSAINMLIEEGALLAAELAEPRPAVGPTPWSTLACSTTTAERVTTWRH